MPLQIIRNDITRLEVDAIVNAANTSLAMGGGVCGAIFTAAGPEQMQQACAGLGPIATGTAVITPGFALPARYVIHTAGPVYNQHTAGRSEQLLRNAYLSSLELAVKHNCTSIAFPLISSGIYGYPKDQALEVARSSILQFLEQENIELDVYLVVFDKSAFRLSQQLLGEVASFIEQHLVEHIEHTYSRGRRRYQVDEQTIAFESPAAEGFELQLGQPFEYHLLKLIRDSGKSEVEVYKKANISRKLFSKIRTGKGYIPGKRTILALALALELDLQQTQTLLNHAGYALTRNQKFDVIIEYFISRRQYDIHSANTMLFFHDQPLLGA